MRRTATTTVLVLLVALLTSAATENGVCNAENQECSRSDIDETHEKKEHCIDEHEHCELWASGGECRKNPEYMLTVCRRSCNTCDQTGQLKEKILDHDETTFGEPQSVLRPSDTELVKEIIAKSIVYMKEIANDSTYDSIVCRNNNELCSQWAVGSGCDDNPKYMKRECAPACQSCDFVLKGDVECRINPSDKNALEVGGMDSLFERMIKISNTMGLKPKVWSRPTEGPWILTLENFIKAKEITVLLEYGAKAGYKRSMAGDIIHASRTSSHTWCEGECYNDPIVKGIRERMVNITGIPDVNFESLQLLRYEKEQFYKSHNDMITNHVHQRHGPRILTFFLYLNEVEEGGETAFPKLNITVEPKGGRVLIWPSVLDEDIFAEDPRTDHAAQPVMKGKKFAANAWIHLRDFQTPHALGCPS